MSVAAESGVATTFVDRGAPQYRSKTDPASVTSAGVSIETGYGTVAAGAVNTVALAAYDHQGEAALKHDLGVSYELSLAEVLTLSGGYTATLLPEAQPMSDGHELTAGAEVDLGVATASATAALEVRALDLYTSLGVAREIELGTGVSLELMASVGSCHHRRAVLQPNDVTVGGTLRAEAGGGVYLGASLNAAYLAAPSASLDGAQTSTGARTTGWGTLAIGYEG